MATYYIDFSAGLDANAGTTKGAPYKNHPYMANFTGTYAHTSGDQFIFKGGVTWTSACFPLTIAAAGSSGGNDYYGVDMTWYNGGSWVRPVFDGQYAVGDVISGANGQAYVTIDNLEICHVLCQQNYNAGLIQCYEPANWLIENCYLHGWRLNASGAGTDGQQGGVCFSIGGAFGGLLSTTVTNCTITNAENALGGSTGQTSQNGVACTYVGTIDHCTIHDVASAIIFNVTTRFSKIYNCTYPITGTTQNNSSYDSLAHTDGVYLTPNASNETVCYFYGNYLYNAGGAGNLLYPNPTGTTANGTNPNPITFYIYNNVIFGPATNQTCINIDTFAPGPNFTGTAGPVYCYNNTFVLQGANDGSAAISISAPSGTSGTIGYRPILSVLTLINNQLLYISGGTLSNASQGTNVTTLTQNNNSAGQTVTAAASNYNVISSILNSAPSGPPWPFQPTNSGGNTIDAGVSKSGFFTTDILGVSRPQGLAWDIGAYEYLPSTGPSKAQLAVLGAYAYGLKLADE